jgi:hypothetical protein
VNVTGMAGPSVMNAGTASIRGSKVWGLSKAVFHGWGASALDGEMVTLHDHHDHDHDPAGSPSASSPHRLEQCLTTKNGSIEGLWW